MARDVWGDYVTPDMYEEALKRGICKTTIYSRIARGMKAADAITKPIKGRRSEAYKDALKVAVEKEINPDTFRLRVDALGWTLEQAANTPTLTRSEAIKLGREARRRNQRNIPAEIAQLALDNGICYSTLYDRITRRFMDMNTAATKPLMSKQEWKKRWNAWDW